MSIDLKFEEINDQKIWDDFVQTQERYSFVQSFGYTNVVKALVDEIFRIGVYKNDELIGLLPIGIIKAKRGKYLRLRHGPILNDEGWRNFSQIVQYLKNFAKKHGLNFIRLQPIIKSNEILIENGFEEAPTHNLDAQHTLQLRIVDFRSEDAEKTMDKVLLNMRKNTRYYIRKSEKEGVEVIRDDEDFETFYQLLKQTAGRQGYTTWPREYFENIFNEFTLKGLNLYFATFKNKRIAIGLFLDYGKYRFYLEGGMHMAYSKKYPAYAIQARSISDAVSKDVEIYDFWGGVAPKDDKGNAVENYPWAGINLFKAGFGGDEVSMIHPHDLPLNKKYKLTYWFEKFERWKRGY